MPDNTDPKPPRVQRANSKEPKEARSSLLETNLTAEGRIKQIKNMTLASNVGGPSASKNSTVNVIREMGSFRKGYRWR